MTEDERVKILEEIAQGEESFEKWVAIELLAMRKRVEILEKKYDKTW